MGKELLSPRLRSIRRSKEAVQRHPDKIKGAFHSSFSKRFVHRCSGTRAKPKESEYASRCDVDAPKACPDARQSRTANNK